MASEPLYSSVIESPYEHVDLGIANPPEPYIVAWSQSSEGYYWLRLDLDMEAIEAGKPYYINGAAILKESVRFCDRFDAARSAKAHRSVRRGIDWADEALSELEGADGS